MTRCSSGYLMANQRNSLNHIAINIPHLWWLGPDPREPKLELSTEEENFYEFFRKIIVLKFDRLSAVFCLVKSFGIIKLKHHFMKRLMFFKLILKKNSFGKNIILFIIYFLEICWNLIIWWIIFEIRNLKKLNSQKAISLSQPFQSHK